MMMRMPVSSSVHTDPISKELYARIIEVLTIPDYWMRQDNIFATPKLFSQINGLLHAHTCKECGQIRPLRPNRSEQHKKYMKTYTVPRSKFSNDKDAMTAYIELDQKFYREVYCVCCGNMKKLATPEEEVENFQSHYR